MPSHDSRLAADQRQAGGRDAAQRQASRRRAGERDAGVRKVSRVTWWAGTVGAACSVMIATGFAEHASAASGSSGTGGTHAEHTRRTQDGQGTIVIPNQPPSPAAGQGQVNSGAS